MWPTGGWRDGPAVWYCTGPAESEVAAGGVAGNADKKKGLMLSPKAPSPRLPPASSVLRTSNGALG